MLQFYEKRSWRSFVRSWWFVGFLGILVLLMGLAVYDRYTIEREMYERRIEAEEKLQVLEDRKAEINDKVEYLESDRGIEAEMRRNFDVAQPGEQVVIILDPKDEVISPNDPKPVELEEDAPWYIFWR